MTKTNRKKVPANFVVSSAHQGDFQNCSETTRSFFSDHNDTSSSDIFAAE
jgi:hypothetical protein